MPRPDPTPRDESLRTALAWARYRKLMRWMALAAAVAVLLALLYLRLTLDEFPVHMVIATVAGVGFSVLLGTALMGLVFVSNASGHDDEATLKDGNHDHR